MTPSTPSALQRKAPGEGSRPPAPRAPRAGGRAAAAGRWASVALIVAGVAARLAEYWSGRSLWLDESFLWITLDRVPASALAGPLDLAQGAPIPFLLAEKGMLETFGDGEWALRLLPLICGIATLVVAQRVAARVLSPERAWIVVAPLALGQAPVFYATEVKQYALDILVATLLLWVVVWAAHSPMTAGRAALLGGAGAAAVWCSDPAVFVLAGGGASLLVAAAAARDRERLRALVAATAAWVVSFGALYLVHIRDLSTVRGLATADTGGGTTHAVWRTVKLIPGALQYGIGNGLLVPLLAQALVLFGILALWRSGRRVEAGTLAGTIAALLPTVLAGQYPIGGRFTVFLAPVLALALGAGVMAVWDAARARGRTAAVAVVVAGAVCAIPVLMRLADGAIVNEEMDAVTAAVAERMQPGDQIYLYYASQYAYAYYGPREGIGFTPRPTRGEGAAPRSEFSEEDAPVLASGPGRVVGRWDASPARLVADVDRMRGARRFWLVFSHHNEGEDTRIVRRARTFARPLETVHADGAFAVLMEGRR